MAIDFRPVFFVCGLVLATQAMMMAVPAVADAVAGNDDWQVFAVSAVATLFVGGLLILTNRSPRGELSLRQAFALTGAAWFITAAFGALPFAFANLKLSYTDAFFEAMSGITTTGSTVITGLDQAPPGILLWRSLLQWLGGIGIIVVAVAILPMLQVGGMRIFRMESSDRSEKVMPRAAQIATGIAFIYLGLSAACAASYWLAGMSAFEAVNHAMTTISTGGYSTSDASIAHFASPAIDWIATVFMILGALPFVLYLQAVQGRPLVLMQNSQVRWFACIVVAVVGTMCAWISVVQDVPVLQALRHTAFNVVSVVTTTGYATADYGQWGGFAVVGFFLLMFVGGCAGSTTGGIKVFRFQVLYATAQVQMARLMQPHGVFVTYYDRQPIPLPVTSSVMGFFFIYVVAFAVLTMLLGLLGLDFLTSISGAATVLGNVGPGLGEVIGPAGTFQSLPDAAKWLLAAGMLLGRLELFTVLVLFLPSFWRG